jgi:hypothetical protein
MQIDENLALVRNFWPCRRLMGANRTYGRTATVKEAASAKGHVEVMQKKGNCPDSKPTTPFPSTDRSAKTGKFPGFRAIAT